MFQKPKHPGQKAKKPKSQKAKSLGRNTTFDLLVNF
jgi:hypothetical protein